MSSLVPGARFASFRLLAPLGRGASGTVWRAEDPHGREVALKVLLGTGPRARERFAREGRIAASLEHPGIPKVHEAGELEGTPYLVSALVDGSSLDEHLAEVPTPGLLPLLLEVAEAVAYAHGRGVVHRDLKPQNILVDREGRAHVADFGLAATQDDERLTQTHTLIGTPHYLPPERLTGCADPRSPATDVWALGVLLYRVLTGRLPFPSDSFLELTAQVTGATPERPGALAPDVQPALEALCLRALSKAPEARPRDAGEFAAALRAALAGEAHALHRRPRRALWLLAALLPLALALGAAALWPRAAPARPARPRPPRRALLDPRVEDLREVLRQLATPAARHRLTASPARWASAGCQALLAAERLRRERDLLETLARGAATEASLVADLGALAAVLAVQAPGTGAPSTSRPLIRAVVGWFLDEVRRRRSVPLAALEAASRLNVWLDARGAEVCVSQDLFGLYVSGALSAEGLSRGLVASLRLDCPSGPQPYFDVPAEVLPSGDDPWSRFAHMRMGLERYDVRLAERLYEVLRDPPPGLVLGPRVWAETAFSVLTALDDPAVKRELILAGLALDPRCCSLYVALARERYAARDFPGAVEAIERALALFREQGFDRGYAGEFTWGLAHRIWVECLVAAGERQRALEAFLQLRVASPNEANRLEQRLPWLGSGR
ncbi:MAG: serine/threonine-protein kinase [Planctomycetota bacterium]